MSLGAVKGKVVRFIFFFDYYYCCHMVYIIYLECLSLSILSWLPYIACGILCLRLCFLLLFLSLLEQNVTRKHREN